MKKELILKIIKENRYYFIVTLVLVIACGYFWYATLQEGELLAKQQQVWSQKRRQLAVRTEAQETDRYHRDKEQRAQLYHTIPYRHEFPRVISEVIDFAALHGATLGSLSYKTRKIPDLEGIFAYTMTCTATGNYTGLKRLIGDLERLDGISTLDRFSFSTLDSAFEKVALDLQLTIYLREERP